jgi:Flp pilus assembly pilin Flp
MQLFYALWRDDSAQDTSEYALLLLLITAAVVAAVTALSGQITAVFNKISGCLKNSTC